MTILPRVSVFLGLSLDGYIAREDHSLDWLALVQMDPPEDTGYQSLMSSIDTLVMGRTTYDTVLTFPEWPFSNKRVVVLTHHALSRRHNEEFAHGNLPDILEQLAQEGCRHIYLDGGDIVRQGLQANVVTTLTLSWVPIILGSGIPLFLQGLPQQLWRLTNSRAFPSGLLQATFEAKGIDEQSKMLHQQ